MISDYLVSRNDDEIQVRLILEKKEDYHLLQVNRLHVSAISERGDAFRKTLTQLGENLRSRNLFAQNSPDMLPVLYGGSHDTELMTLFVDSGPTAPKDPAQRLYQYRTTESLFSLPGEEINQRLTNFFLFFQGYDIISEDEILSKTRAGSWSLLSGLHWMTYAPNLGRKQDFTSILKERPAKTPGPEALLGGFLGGMMSLAKEAQPSLMHAGLVGRLQHLDPELDYSEILEIVRMMIAISDHEGVNVQSVMEKYTHQEVFRRYKEMAQGSVKWKTLEDFDRRLVALSELGINPYWYDVSVSQVFFSRKADGESRRPSGRSNEVELRLQGVKDLFKSDRDSKE